MIYCVGRRRNSACGSMRFFNATSISIVAAMIRFPVQSKISLDNNIASIGPIFHEPIVDQIGRPKPFASSPSSPIPWHFSGGLRLLGVALDAQRLDY